MNALVDVPGDERCQQVDRLAVELSSEFIGRGEDDVVTAIAETLRRIGDVLGIDRSTLVEFSDDGEAVRATHHWASDRLSGVDIETQVPRLTWLLDRQCMNGEPVVLARIPEGLPIELVTPRLMEDLRETPLRSAVVMPIAIAGRRACALALEAARADISWSEPLAVRLRLLGEIMAGALYRWRQDEALRHSRAELARLTAARATPTAPAAHREIARTDLDEIVGDSVAWQTVLARVQEVMSTHSTVLLLGETGTGKEVIARALHAHGPRHAFPLVSVNCAALPPTLIESELFGHERGAFTGAVAMRPGRFQLAHRGTLFLDEIGDLPLDLQTKLLRVLQEGEFERLGSSHTQKVNVRIIAATHRDLARAAGDGEFREDLYYRLSVFPIRVPPLRERRDDVPALVWFIIRKRQREMQRWIRNVPADVMDALQRYSWPGNVRELENVIERALIHSTDDTLRLLDDAFEILAPRVPADAGTLSAVERTHIEDVLRECRWRINGVGNAAERLGLHPNTLRFRMKKLGIVRGRDDGRNGERHEGWRDRPGVRRDVRASR